MAKPTMSGFLMGRPMTTPAAPPAPQQFPPGMPFDAFGFLPPGVQLPGETTIAPMLREVEDMRRANRGMLRQIDAETAAPQPDHSLAGTVMSPRGVWEEPGALLADAPTQRTVQTVPIGSPSDANPQPPPATPPASLAATQPPQPDADAIMQGAQQAHVQNNPFETTTKAEPSGFQLALADVLKTAEPPASQVGAGLGRPIIPSRPRRPMGPSPQPSRLSMASFLQRS